MDERASRLDKLLSIPVDHILLLVRECIFGSRSCSQFDLETHVKKLLESCIKRGDDESSWLFEKLRDISLCEENIIARSTSLANIMAMEDTPRAQYYEGMLRLWFDDNLSIKLLLRSANSGFVPAMAAIGEELKSLHWIKKAAKRKDPFGLWLLGSHKKNMRDYDYNFIFAAAECGYDWAMRVVGLHYSMRLPSWNDALRYYARYILYSMNDNDCGNYIRTDTTNTNDLKGMYVIGSEIEGYAALWYQNYEPQRCLLKCIEVYLTIMHHARRAALQATGEFRRHVGRDVAGLIGKMVYNTRTDVQVWWW
jgi:hypothetical protein